MSQQVLELDPAEALEVAAREVSAAFADGWTPDPVLTVSQWADEHRFLSQVSSSESGQWRTERTPYLREIMDALGPDHPARRVVFMKGAQIGATEAGNNWIGYVVTTVPGPMLMVRPSLDDARLASKQRLAPMIANSPALSSRIADSRSRDSGNTTLVKEFPGGLLILTGANSGTGLRGMPIRFLFCDEVDEYPGDVNGQGDPLKLAENRTNSYPTRKKVFLVSTPTVKGLSKIEKEFNQTDQRRYFVPCPYCNHLDFIRWENVRWDLEEVGGERLPVNARLVCVACSREATESWKPRMLAAGRWTPTRREGTRVVIREDWPDPTRIGFHLPGFYSPVGLGESWEEQAKEFLAAKDDAYRLKVWWNTTKGETWEERGDSAEPGEILERLETYDAEVPHGAGALICSVDVQGDRLEAKVKAYGAGEESWLIAFTQLHGDPEQDKVWRDLDRFRRRAFTHQSGQEVKVDLTVVDSNYMAEKVYRYTKARQGEPCYAVRGGHEKGKPVVGRPSANNRYRAKVFTLCVDTAKEIIYARLRIRHPGPGFMHFPDWVDQEYADQLTAETGVRKYKKGRGVVREWIKTRERNEALDLEVYGLAGLYILGPGFVKRLPERAEQWSRPPEKVEAQKAQEKAQRRLRRGRGWVSGWNQ